MNKFSFLAVLAATTSIGLTQPAETNPAGAPVPKSKNPPPPVVVAPPPATPAAPSAPFVYDQKPITGRPVLVQPQEAQGIIDRFKAAYPKMGSPRLLIYVNRELVDEKSGLKLIARTEKTESVENKSESDLTLDPNYKPTDPAKGVNITAEGNVTVRGDVSSRDIYPGKGKTSARTEKIVRENRYRRDEAATPTLADKQAVRDVERLFGRPLRMGGAALADQRTATQLMEGKTFESLSTEGEQARKDREALAKVADVVLEVLISSKDVQVSEVSGNRTVSIPDLQATAVRLKDAKILGQAASSDVLGRDRNYSARNFDVREIAEATALALMEDMLTGLE